MDLRLTYLHTMITRYGFREDTKVAAFTGDSPSSLAGLAMKPGDIGNYITLKIMSCRLELL